MTSNATISILSTSWVQSDQKENKWELTLQIIGHVVADSMQISVQCVGVDKRYFMIDHISLILDSGIIIIVHFIIIIW
jgi:hypothetical protein